MAQCAQEIILQNGFEKKIKLVKKRSTELTAGSAGKEWVEPVIPCSELISGS